MKRNPSELKKPITLAITIVAILTLLIGSYAFFSDRVNSTETFSTASFTKDGYSLSRTVNLVPYLAGEDISVTVIENNGKEEPVQSEITMSVGWTSPDTGSSPFGNANSANNATIQVDGTPVTYTYNKNTGKITFKLPTHKMEASTVGNQRTVTFHIPESLKATGTLAFSFDKVKLSQTTKLNGTGFYVEYNNTELNQKEKLDFDAQVVWDFSETLGTKKIIGYLTGSTGNYGIKVEGSGIMHDWTSETASSQSHYRDSVTSLDLSSGLTRIGDHAFDGFNKVKSLTIPENVKTIGDYAFENLSIKNLVIPAGVTKLEKMAFGNIEELTEITFKGSSTQFPTAGEGSGAFYVGDPYTESNPLRTKITNAGSNVLSYNWTADHRGYVVTVKTAEGGTMTAKPSVAINGKTITLTPVADKAYGYNGATVKYTNASGSTQTITLSEKEVTFTMPAADVTVTPNWKLTIPPTLAKQDTWYTQGGTTIDKTDITSITFKDSYKPASYVDSWDASDGKVGTVTAYVENDGNGGYKLTIAGNGYGLIYANADSTEAFAGFETVTKITDISLLDTRNTTTMEAMFADCYHLTALDVSHFNTSKVTNITYMFYSCSSLETMNFATHKATAKDGTGYTAWDTSKVEAAYFFLSMYNAPIEFAEYALTSVDVTGWDTSSLIEADRMFMSNWNLTEIKGIADWNMSKVTTIEFLFYGCSSLETVDVSKWTFTDLQSVKGTFSSCSGLKSIDISQWNMSKVTNSQEMFEYCSSLTELTLPENLSVIGKKFARYCPALTTITFLQPADMEITFPDEGSSGAFYVSSNMDDENPVSYSRTNPLRTEVVTSNKDVMGYDWPTDYRGFTVTAKAVTGGTLKASPTVAINGKTITLTPTADSQYVYKGAAVTYKEKTGTEKTISLAADELKFTMPVADVTITPKWVVNAPPMLAEQDLWQYTDADAGTNVIDYDLLQTINIVDTYKPDGTETSWDASAYETVDGVAYNGKVTAYLSSDKKTLTVAGNGYGRIYANPDSSWALSSSYSGMAELTRINGAENLDTSLVTDASSMFSMNRKLEYVNVSNWDTSKIEFTNSSGYYGMFMSCEKLTDLDVSGWKTGNMIETRRMFSGCTSLDEIDVSVWDMSSCESMADMFAETAISTIAVDDWNTSNLYDSYNMFEGCKNLTEINLSKWDVRKLDDTSEMFKDSGLTKIDLSSWDDSVVSCVSSMFEGCEDLTDVNIVGWDLSNLEAVTNDFYSSSAGMFRGCTSLEELTIPSSLKVFGVKFAEGCTKLTNIEFQHAADADLSFATAGSSYGAFYVGDPYTEAAPLRTKVITDNAKVLDYGWNKDHRGYTVTITSVTGGKLKSDASVAINGRTITLTPSADDSYQYDGATVTYTEKSGSKKTISLDADKLTFTMPAADVTVTPKWVFNAPRPMLATQNSWQYIKNDDDSYTKVIDYATAAKVTTINIVDTYDPDGTETSWDASAYETIDGVEYNGKVTAYLSSDKKTLTLAGNGYGKIFAHPNSSSAFAYFEAVTSINGADKLEMSTANNTGYMFSDNYSLTTLDVSNWDMRNVTNMVGMFYICYDLEALNVAGWDTGNVTNMSYMFNDCLALSELTGIRNWDTQKVENTRRMFLGCNSIQSLDLSTKNVTLNNRTYDSWDTGEVTDMSYMFGSSDSTHHKMESLNISTFDMRKVTNMQAMFQRCDSLKTLNVTPTQHTLNKDTFHSWDVANVQKMYIAFKDCSSLVSLDLSGWDTTGVGTGDNYTIDDFAEMFKGCSSLETLNVSRKEMTGINKRNYTSWNTSNAFYMGSMFEDCSSLKSLNLKNWNNASATDMDNMFDGCSSMTEINLTNFTTAACRSMINMFHDCSSLTSVDLSSFDTGKVNYMTNMFTNCSSLKKLDISSFNTQSIRSGRLQQFAQNCTSLTEIVLGPNFVQDSVRPASGSATGMFYVGDPYSSANLLGTKVTGANTSMMEYNWAGDFRGYTITVNNVEGGTVKADQTVAINGKTITLTPTAETGYSYNGATVSYTDDNGAMKTITLDASTKIFTMPAGDANVTPKWQANGPVVTITSPEATSSSDPTVTYNSTYTVTGTVSDVDGDLKSVKVNGEEVTVANDGTWSLDLATTPTNTYTLTAVATDEAGNTATVTHYLKCSYYPFVITADNRTEVGYTGAANEELRIPSSFSGTDGKWYRTIGIEAKAFMNCTNLKSVDIPDSVLTIGSEAFNGCTGLVNVTLPDGLVKLNYRTFYDCTSLSSITIPESVTTIGIAVFMDCDSLTAVTIPASVTSIGNTAFSNCDSLASVTLSYGLKTIDTGAFGSCPNLKSITIPESVTKIGTGAFDYTGLTNLSIPASVTSIGEHPCSSADILASFTVDSDNPNYCSIDGVLYTKDMSRLVQYPAGKSGTSYTIPSTVSTVGAEAFIHNEKLKTVIIPESVTTIDYNAFKDCDGLKTITIPASVTSIGRNPFASASLMTNIDVDSANQNYCSVDGVLYTEDMKTLIGYPCASGGVFTVPSSVTTIDEEAFSGNQKLESVIIPTSVTAIGWCAFTDLQLDSSLDVYYCGTENQWNAMDLANGMWNYRSGVTINVHYNYIATASLSLTPAPKLPEGVTAGKAQSFCAMPDVTKLNEHASANAPENTILYAWLVDSGMAQQIVSLEDFEAALDSVYSEEPEWEMIITPLYQAVETDPAEEAKESEQCEEFKGTEFGVETEASESTKPSETIEGDSVTVPEDGTSEASSAAASKEAPSEDPAAEPSEAPESTEPSEPEESVDMIEATEASEVQEPANSGEAVE